MVSIASRAATGVAWSLASGLVVRLITVAGTLALTRFLSPSEYGEVTAAAICVLTSARIVNLGTGAYIVAYQSPPTVVFQAFALHLLTTSAGCLAVLLLRQPLGQLLEAPGMVRFVPGLAVATLVLQTSHVPSATLLRALRFRVVAVCRALGELAFTATAVALAPLWGGTAIVAGNLARATLVSSLLLARARRQEWLRVAPIDRAAAKSLLGFGLPFCASNLAETAAYYWDSLLISRFFGVRAIGQYSLAYSLACTPIAQLGEHVADVLLPSFAQMEPERRREALTRAVGLLAFLLLPLAMGLAAVAPTLVATLLDPRWSGVAPLLTTLSGVALLYPVSGVATAYLQAQRRPRTIMTLSVFKAAAVLGLVATIGRAGLGWAAAAVVLAFLMHAAVCTWVLRRQDQITLGAWLRGVLPPLSAGVIMVAVIVALRPALRAAGVGPGGLSLLLEIGAGALAYAAGAALLARPLALDLWSLARTVVGAHSDGSRETT